MSNQDIADALFVDEDDMAQLATQNELFKLIGVEAERERLNSSKSTPFNKLKESK